MRVSGATSISTSQVRVCDQQEGERNYHLFYEVSQLLPAAAMTSDIWISSGSVASDLQQACAAAALASDCNYSPDTKEEAVEAVEDQILSYFSKLSLTRQVDTKAIHHALLPFVSVASKLNALKVYRENLTRFKVSSEALERKSEE